MKWLMKNNLKEYKNYLIKWLKTEILKANAKGAILGLSGGVDSSVVSILIKEAFPNDHLVLIMPSNKNFLDYEYSKKLVKINKLKYKEINIKKISKIIFNNAKIDDNKIIKGNILARIRMTILYAYAQMNNYLVIGTDNASELYIGYFTKFGDGAADLYPISNLIKKNVKLIAKILNIPEYIINRDPTASLWENQTDEKELQFTYEDLDNFITKKFDIINEDVKEKIKTLHNNSEHKRKMGPKPLTLNEFKK